MNNAVLRYVLEPFQWFVSAKLLLSVTLDDLLTGQPYRSVARPWTHGDDLSSRYPAPTFRSPEWTWARNRPRRVVRRRR